MPSVRDSVGSYMGERRQNSSLNGMQKSKPKREIENFNQITTIKNYFANTK
jgi:hypothetical protein